MGGGIGLGFGAATRRRGVRDEEGQEIGAVALVCEREDELARLSSTLIRLCSIFHMDYLCTYRLDIYIYIYTKKLYLFLNNHIYIYI